MNNGCQNSAQKGTDHTETFRNNKKWYFKVYEVKKRFRKVDTNLVILALTSNYAYPPKYPFSQVRSYIYIYYIDSKESLIIENLYNGNREVYIYILK